MVRNVSLVLLSNKHLDKIWLSFVVEERKIVPSKRSLLEI